MKSWAALFLSCCILCVYCSPDIRPDTAIKNIKKNQLKSSKTISRNGLIATVTYIPGEFFSAREMAHDSSITSVLAGIKDNYRSALFYRRVDKRSYGRSAEKIADDDCTNPSGSSSVIEKAE
jgi:hypothetical protein